MKKTIVTLLTIALFFSIASISMVGIAKANSDLKVTIDGKLVNFPDAKPMINRDKRTIVPVRFISQELGYQVDWNSTTQIVTIKSKDKTISLKIGESKATVNGTTMTFDTRATVSSGRTYVPLRFIAETMGVYVGWDEKTRTVIIDTTRKPEPSTTTQQPSNGGHGPTVRFDENGVPIPRDGIWYPTETPSTEGKKAPN
ncbi:copper amine oxidase N-terminal domain-containing protein [Caldalkalibacillus mannanilyticus]|uniref:copper amine oxidase N-terminal domain-containing protein n=1 Tax=Caldalkalibacillus mannanilyticus TaxID=1418 RepID=UPI000468B625|nr:copper amine oxidase N-terminal domain-containing protein [Caldalkalibacillus mannanilyticus]